MHGDTMYRTNAQLWRTEETKTEIRETLEGKLEEVKRVDVMKGGQPDTVIDISIRNDQGLARALFPMNIPEQEYGQMISSTVRYICTRNSKDSLRSTHSLKVMDGLEKDKTYACGLGNVLVIKY